MEDMDRGRVDYLKLYANVEDEGFLNSLNIPDHSRKMISLLFEQGDLVNNLYVPDLALEGLVHEGNTPYQSLRSLHSLKKKRIILYDLVEKDPKGEEYVKRVDLPDISNVDHDKRIVYESPPIETTTQRYFEDEEENLKLSDNADYDRYAMFNLEYPVMYFCHQEDIEFDKGSPLEINKLYKAIEDDSLAEMLIDIDQPVMLEFLNYVQSMFDQTLSSIRRNNNEIPDSSDDMSSGGGLVERDDSARNWTEVRQTQEYGVKVDEVQRVARNSARQGTYPEEAENPYGQERESENNIPGTEMGQS